MNVHEMVNCDLFLFDRSWLLLRSALRSAGKLRMGLDSTYCIINDFIFWSHLAALYVLQSAVSVMILSLLHWPAPGIPNCLLG